MKNMKEIILKSGFKIFTIILALTFFINVQSALSNTSTVINLQSQNESVNENGQEYFPGYGYADSNYIYKLGLETDRQLMHAYWKFEKETIEAANYCELVISVELMANLEAQVGILKILKLFDITINGKIMAAAKVSFELKKTLQTECRLKYEKNKIWFQLMRAPKDYWSQPKWEVCGKTYQFMEEPTGEEVVIDATISEPGIPGFPESIQSDNRGWSGLAVQIAGKMSQGDITLLKSLSDYYEQAEETEIIENMKFIKMFREIYLVQSLNEGAFSDEVKRLVKKIDFNTEVL